MKFLQSILSEGGQQSHKRLIALVLTTFIVLIGFFSLLPIEIGEHNCELISNIVENSTFIIIGVVAASTADKFRFKK